MCRWLNIPRSSYYDKAIEANSEAVIGETINTIVSESQTEAFYLTEDGNVLPEYTKHPILLTVRDEEGVGIKSQKISLYNSIELKVSEKVKGDKGQVNFADKLMTGTFYIYKVNDIEMGTITPGNNSSCHLTSNQIVKETKPK